MEINLTLAEALKRASQQLRKKMLHSVELLQKAEKIALNYDTEQGYYLAFSGGKDSQALYHMTQLAGVKFQGHMNLTSVDPPEVIRFVKQNYPEVELIKPKKSIFQICHRKADFAYHACALVLCRIQGNGRCWQSHAYRHTQGRELAPSKAQ